MLLRYTIAMTTIPEFYEEASPFVSMFNDFAAKHNLEKRSAADHICYKCATKESFESMRSMFEKESIFIYQSIISKRRIAIIKLPDSIQTSLGEIRYLELSDQKPDGSQKEGFDHIEAYPLNRSYFDMVEELQKKERIVEVIRPHHSTHDIEIGKGFLFRCTEGPLIEKIKREEMV